TCTGQERFSKPRGCPKRLGWRKIHPKAERRALRTHRVHRRRVRRTRAVLRARQAKAQHPQLTRVARALRTRTPCPLAVRTLQFRAASAPPPWATTTSHSLRIRPEPSTP